MHAHCIAQHHSKVPLRLPLPQKMVTLGVAQALQQ